MNVKIIAILVIFINNFRICQSKKYHNFSLFNLIPTEPDHIQFLQNLDQQKYIDVIFWKKPHKLYEDVQLIVNPVDTNLFMERANHYKLNITLLNNDIQQAFDSQIIRRYFRLRAETFTWENYHSLEDIYQWLADVALKYPNIAELVSIGKSAEGRDIYVMSVKKSSAKFRVIVEGGIHGCEWISVEFVTYLADQLIRNDITKDWQLGKLLKMYEFHLIPVVNPDGYVYSQTTNRLWIKNRRMVGNSIGVDLNRNFNYNFGKFGTSLDEKDEHFCGPFAFSEPESKVLSDFIATKRKTLRFYFSFHGYGQKIIIPFGDRVKHIDNYGEAENYGKQAIWKMYKTSGIKYSIGTTYDTLGLRISGNSASYVKKMYNVRFVYTFLLRDNGTYGLALPPDHILPTCKETVAGIKELMTARPKKVKFRLFNRAQSLKRHTILILSFIFIYFIINIL